MKDYYPNIKKKIIKKNHNPLKKIVRNGRIFTYDIITREEASNLREENNYIGLATCVAACLLPFC